MSIVTTVQLFDSFLGSQEGIHSIILPDIFSSGGSKNVYIDKFARVTCIPGYTKQNSAAYTTDTGASASMIRALVPYRKTAGGAITRKLLFLLDDGVNEHELWVSSDSGATATFLYDAGAGSVGQVLDAAQFADTLYLCNGKIQPRKYDGTTMAATGLTQSPTITATDSGTSGNLLGNYLYKLVSTIAGVRQNGSVTSASLLLSNKQGALAWTADTNLSVDGYEIYRTTGTGTLFYYLTTISGRLTAAYTDNISDLTILENRTLDEHGDAPPVAYFCEPHKQRMWWFRTDTYPTRGYWSDPGAPESVYTNNYLDFSDSETVGDQITGALGNYGGRLVVGTEKTLWAVTGTGAIIGDITDWYKTRTNVSTGWVSSRAAVRIPAGSKYTDQTGRHQTTSVASVAYFTPLGDIRVFDGDNDLIVSHPLRDTIGAFNYTQRAKIWAMIDSSNTQAIWCFPSGSATEPDTMIAWNFRFGVWYTWPTMPFGHGVELDISTDPALLLTGQAATATGGYIYQFFTGTSFDGSAIAAQWMTKTLYGVDPTAKPALTNRKRWRWLDVLFKISQDVLITVEWLSGRALDSSAALSSVTVMPNQATLVTADGSTVLSADGSSLVISAASAQQMALLHDNTGKYLHDEGIRLRVKTATTTASWSLEAMQLGYQILPGVKRRDQ